jgi:hypothetical protein
MLAGTWMQSLGSPLPYLLMSRCTTLARRCGRRELGCSEAEVLAELRYDLPATYKFHK